MKVKIEEFDAFVERLKDMIPFTALAPVDENAILVRIKALKGVKSLNRSSSFIEIQIYAQTLKDCQW